MLQPLRCEAGAGDGGQRYRFPFSRKKPGPPAFPLGVPGEGCSACPTLSVLRLHLADPREVLPTRLGSRTNVAHIATPTRLPPAGPPASTPGHLHTLTKPPLLFSLAQPPRRPGSPQRKPTVPLPSMCFSVPLAHGREMPAVCPQDPIHAAFSQSHFSISFLLLLLHPAPQYTKQSYKMGFVFFFSTGIKS